MALSLHASLGERERSERDPPRAIGDEAVAINGAQLFAPHQPAVHDRDGWTRRTLNVDEVETAALRGRYVELGRRLAWKARGGDLNLDECAHVVRALRDAHLELLGSRCLAGEKGRREAEQEADPR